ncbi:hypothetical protein U3516DRAFT_899564 [Neocallimastix sp. 'constans']
MDIFFNIFIIYFHFNLAISFIKSHTILYNTFKTIRLKNSSSYFFPSICFIAILHDLNSFRISFTEKEPFS